MRAATLLSPAFVMLAGCDFDGNVMPWRDTANSLSPMGVKRFSPSRATIRSKRAYRSAAAFFEMAPVGCGPYKLDALTRSHNAHLNTRSDVHTYTSGTAHYNDVIMLIAGVTVTAGLPGLPHHWAADALITHCPIPTFTMRLPQFQCIAEVVHGAPCLSCPTRAL